MSNTAIYNAFNIQTWKFTIKKNQYSYLLEKKTFKSKPLCCKLALRFYNLILPFE